MLTGCDGLYLSVEVSSTDTMTEDLSDDSSGDGKESWNNTEEKNDDESTIVDRTETEENRREQEVFGYLWTSTPAEQVTRFIFYKNRHFSAQPQTYS